MWDAQARSYGGLFYALSALRKEDHLQGSWQMDEALRLFAWFNAHLSTPGRLDWQTRRVRVSGVCWFRDAAQPFVRHARELAWLVSDLGAPIEMRRSRAPGRIIWQDAHQVVASRHLL